MIGKVVSSPWLLFVPSLLILASCYVVPVGSLLKTSFGQGGWSFDHYERALYDPAYMEILIRTLVISLQVTVLTVIIGYPLAYMIVKAPERLQNILLLMVAVPLWTSSLVRSFGWIVLLGREGILNQLGLQTGIMDEPVQMLYGRAAVLVGFVHIMIPLLVFPLVSVMKRIPPGLSAIGMSLGASRTNAFWLVFLPLSIPGVSSGAVLVFVISTGFFVTPTLLGGLSDTTYVMLIQQEVELTFDWPLAAAMSVILLLVTACFVLLFGRFLRVTGEGSDTELQKHRPGRLIGASAALLGWLSTRRIVQATFRSKQDLRATVGTGRAVQVAGWLAIAYLLIPILILFPLSLSPAPYLEFPPSSLSLRWYDNFFAREDWTSAATRSFQAALAVMVLATIFGAAAAVAISRTSGRLTLFIFGLLISPMLVPNLVIAVAIYFQFASLGLIGSLLGLILAHTLLALPIVVVIVYGSLKRINMGPERAALSLGASRIRAFMSTTFVAIRPSILAAALFAFLSSFDDVVIAIFISGINSTLPKRMWDGVQLEIDPTIAAVSSLLILLSIGLVLLRELLRGQRDLASG